MSQQPAFVCLCGSSRFEENFKRANRELMFRGIAAYSLSIYQSDNQGIKLNGLEKTIADLVHFNKILNSSAVFVVGDGYIGDSLAREIIWADMHNKPIVEEKDCPDWDTAALRLKVGDWYPSVVSRAREVLSKKEAI